MQPLWMCWCRTARSTMMPAVTFLQMASSWQRSSLAVRGAFLTKASWQCTPWRPITWARCSTPSGLVRDGKPSIVTHGTSAWHSLVRHHLGGSDGHMLPPASQAQVRGSCSVLAGSVAGESQNESPPHHHGITGIFPLWGARVGKELCSQSWLGEVGTLTRCKPVWHCVDLCTRVFTAMLFVTEKNVKFWRVA